MTIETATLAGGCFWCTEAVFRMCAGVLEVESGYIGGSVADPTYKQVCSGTTGHAEAIRITYDPSVISYADLLDVFMATHDPTQLNRQGNDVGTQYRSAIFPLNESQREEAEAAIARANEERDGAVVTTIEGAAQWYPAEDYHQDFLTLNPTYPYIAINDLPKIEELERLFPDIYRAEPALVKGKSS